MDLQDIKTPGLSCDLHDNPDIKERELALSHKILMSVEKPARYIGGESGSVIKDKEKVSVRFAFCFPDSYDIGMSHLGMKILYSLTNQREDYWCERVFAPGIDFEEIMRRENIPLYALESLDPVKDFDFIGGCVIGLPTIGKVIDNSMKSDVLKEREQFLSWSNLSL